MAKGEQKNFRSVAREAKARLKNGFWENYRQDLAGELARAREEGLNESKVERYFAGKVTYTIRGGEDDGFYAAKIVLPAAVKERSKLLLSVFD